MSFFSRNPVRNTCFTVYTSAVQNANIEVGTRLTFMPNPAQKPFYKCADASLRPVPFSKPLILCVEDDPVYLALRKEVLESDGYSVIGVTTGKDALKVLRVSPVSCTIADHMLTGESGVELARDMKQIKPEVPVLLFSGSTPDKLTDIDVYVNKGEPTTEFLRIVRDLITRYSS